MAMSFLNSEYCCWRCIITFSRCWKQWDRCSLHLHSKRTTIAGKKLELCNPLGSITINRIINHKKMARPYDYVFFIFPLFPILSMQIFFSIAMHVSFLCFRDRVHKNILTYYNRDGLFFVRYLQFGIPWGFRDGYLLNEIKFNTKRNEAAHFPRIWFSLIQCL